MKELIIGAFTLIGLLMVCAGIGHVEFPNEELGMKVVMGVVTMIFTAIVVMVCYLLGHEITDLGNNDVK